MIGNQISMVSNTLKRKIWNFITDIKSNSMKEIIFSERKLSERDSRLDIYDFKDNETKDLKFINGYQIEFSKSEDNFRTETDIIII